MPVCISPIRIYVALRHVAGVIGLTLPVGTRPILDCLAVLPLPAHRALAESAVVITVAHAVAVPGAHLAPSGCWLPWDGLGMVHGKCM